jgi:Cu-Zn family superoxide dismutase
LHPLLIKTGNMKSLFFILAAVILAACNNSGNTGHDDTDTSNKLPRETTAHDMGADTASQPMVAKAQAVFSETQADTIVTGNASFDTIPGGKVRMNLDLTIPKLGNKTVAVHIHEHGDCGDRGMASHGHWNPAGKPHGKWGTSDFHSGDIGNVKLDSKGHGTLSLETDLWTLGGSHRSNILKKAVIVHSGVDDFTTQPTGNAGSRIGCGVIQ